MAAEAVNGIVIGFRIAAQPDQVDVAFNGFFYFAAAVNITDIGIDDGFEQHLRMISRAAPAFIAVIELAQVHPFDDLVHYSDRMCLVYLFFPGRGSNSNWWGA